MSTKQINTSTNSNDPSNEPFKLFMGMLELANSAELVRVCLDHKSNRAMDQMMLEGGMKR